MYKILSKIKNEPHFFIIFFITLILSIPLFYGKFVLLDDAYFHVERIYDLAQSIKQGIFRPYIYSTALRNYGYANPVFYPDLFLYIPAIINSFGFNLSISYKIYIVISTLATGIVAYYCLNKIVSNNKLSLIFSCIYMAFPYRIYDLYYRNAVGEVLFFIFFPIVILGLFELVYKNKWITLTIGCTCICYSHILSFLMTIIFIGFVYIFNIKKINKLIIINTLKSIIMIFLLCLNLIAPMLEFFKTDTYFVNVSNPFGSLNSNAIRLFGIVNNNTFLPIVIFSFFCLILFVIYKKYKKVSNTTNMFVIGLTCFIISTDFFPWDLLSTICPLFNKLQFPWRINCFTTFFISVFLALISLKLIDFFNKHDLKTSLFLFKNLSFFSLILFMGFTYYLYSTMPCQYDRNFIPCSIGRGEYLPIGFVGKASSDYDDIQDLLGKVKDRDIIVNGNKYDNVSMEINKNKTFIDIKNIQTINNNIELPFTYYKGYSVYLNGNKINNDKSENGLLQINTNDTGNYSIEVIYEGTIIQKISLTISLLSIILLIILKIKKRI